MKRVLLWVAYPFAGIVLTLALGLGAYAIAVDSVSEPARPLPVDQVRSDDLAPPPEADPGSVSPEPSPSGSVDDKGGEDGSDSDDKSGSNSGSGSSNSGSGSSNSGSGSSDDDKPDDD